MFLLFLLSIIMFFFCLYFYLEQKKLKERIIELELDTKRILERKIIDNKNDIISIDKLSIERKEQSPKKEIVEPIKPAITKEKVSNSIKQEKYKAKPIYSYEIPNNYKIKDNVKENNITNSIMTNEFNPNDFINNKVYQTNTKISNNNATDYLKELSNQLKDEMTPKTIELTDYEKEEEEHAIISYQELLSLKNNINIIDDEKETI